MTEKNDFKLDVVSIRLVKEAPIYSEQSFNKPEEVAAVMGECMCQFDREVVCVVNLSSDLKPINVHFASVGSLNEAMAHPRELFKASILSNAASMMLIHCHPSGNIFPSKADTMMTDRMNKLCELIGIPLLDHIIVGGDNRAFFSFKEKGMIDNPRITLSTDYRNLDIKSPLVAEQGKARGEYGRKIYRGGTCHSKERRSLCRCRKSRLYRKEDWKISHLKGNGLNPYL